MLGNCFQRLPTFGINIDVTMIQQFLSAADKDRALRSLRKLDRHDVSRWALTGGVALEIHRVRLRGEPAIRTLNDLDFIVDSFEQPMIKLEGAFFRGTLPAESLRYPNTQLLSIPFGSKSIHLADS